MRPANTESSLRRDHSTFDSELSGAVLNLQLFRRIMKWLKPYRVTLLISLMLILIALLSHRNNGNHDFQSSGGLYYRWRC